jgi:TPR repeat protein
VEHWASDCREGAIMASFDSPELLKALENIEKGNYSEAFESLVSLSQNSNPKAQCNLANLYHFGWGVKVDGKKAVELYLKVAQQNIREERLSGLAYQNLSTIYVTGLPEIEPDPERARDYFARARAMGFEM